MGSKRDRIPSAPDLRDQVPLEEEEGALDEAGCDIGNEFGPCSPKESADHDMRSSIARRPNGMMYLRDSSVLSTTESIEIQTEEDELYPPKNFAMVYKGVFRSAYPTKKNAAFLLKIGIRSVIYLCQEEYSRQMVQFYEQNQVTVFQHGVSGNKEPFVDISDAMIHTALQRLLDVRNHPILIHCNQGKHRTGSLVGCLRALNRWSMTAIFDEYRRFAGSKSRRADQQFIELFHRKYPRISTDPKFHPHWYMH